MASKENSNTKSVFDGRRHEVAAIRCMIEIRLEGQTSRLSPWGRTELGVARL